MSYSVRWPLIERAASTPLPVIEGKPGETQRRSSRLTWGEITWKSYRMVSRGQVTAPPPENRVSGRAAAAQAEDRAVAPEAHPPDRVAHGDRGVVEPGGDRVDVDGERQPVRRRDPEPAQPGA